MTGDERPEDRSQWRLLVAVGSHKPLQTVTCLRIWGAISPLAMAPVSGNGKPAAPRQYHSLLEIGSRRPLDNGLRFWKWAP